MAERTDYSLLSRQLAELIRDIPYETANMANASALLMESLADLNWAGFYLLRDGQLVLGPFQGKPACILIPMGKGVCGTAAEQGRTVVVPDVHRFPGHIACDGASNSEIVIPLYKEEALYGVMDLDSPLLDRFSEEDRLGLEEFARILSNSFAVQGQNS